MKPAPPDSTARGRARLAWLVAANAPIREAKAAHRRRVVDVFDGRQDLASAVHGGGVVGAHPHPTRQEHPRDVKARRLAEVVGVRFEGEAEQADDHSWKLLE